MGQLEEIKVSIIETNFLDESKRYRAYLKCFYSFTFCWIKFHYMEEKAVCKVPHEEIFYVDDNPDDSSSFNTFEDAKHAALLALEKWRSQIASSTVTSINRHEL